ncbi:MAG: MetQ/NlpA family ABC transporter substrate-binding protein [Bacillota bacterium]|nr:MetQ/NlpA family ABC transporter substrate-binding protein [Bacillota bacterium]
MFNYKKTLSLFSAVILAVSLTACSSKNGTDQGQSLTFGLMPSVDAVPFIIADEKGFFKEQGINVKLEVFKSAKDRDAAFQAGSLDGIIGDEVAVCLYQNADFDVKITGITDGDFMLVAGKDSGIKTISDLKGKSTAISEKTVIEYTLDRILEKSGMQSGDITKSAVPAIPTRLEMLRNGKTDAALLPEPFSTLAVKDGGILLGSANKEDMYPSVSAFTQKAIASKNTDIKSFYKAYNKAVEYINSTPVSEYEATVIKAVGYPEDMKGKISLPKFRSNRLPSDEELKDAIDWSTKKGLIKKTLTPKDLVNDIGLK